MEKCKFCGAQLEQDKTLCPQCGKDNAQAAEPVEEAAALTERSAEKTEAAETSAVQEQTPVPAIEAEDEKPAKAPLSAGKAMLAIAAVVAVVILLAAVVLNSRKPAELPEDTSAAATEAPTVPADGNPDDVTCKGTYSASDDEVIAARDLVVATAGDQELTLGQLQTYYWMEVNNFLMQYGASVAYFGLDYQQSLDTQIFNLQETPMTWQQYFLDVALTSWQSYSAMAAEADAEGVSMTEARMEALQSIEEELNSAAQANGLESAEEMLKLSLGAGAEVEDYKYFMELYYKAMSYYSHLAEGIAPTDEDLEAFYEEHADGYAQSGITKDARYVNVRHILVYPEGADSTNINTGEFDEEAWAAGEAEAQRILEEFLAGDATEDAFAALANQYSQDPGSNTNGGLYEDVTEGEMVEAFNDWCFDEARQVGDTGIVKTNYGYHVMFFSGSRLMWIECTRSDYIQQTANDMVTAVVEKNPLKVNYSDILLASVALT